jgi:hypothetical protein
LRERTLTIGNANGIGRIREGELIDSVRHFGIQDVETLNHEYDHDLLG